MPSLQLVAVSTWLWPALVGLAAIAVAAVLWRVRATRRSGRSPIPGAPSPASTAEELILNVELGPPRGNSEFILSCPRCGFTGALDDLAAVGETVECPACEEPFEVLEPEFTTAGA